MPRISNRMFAALALSTALIWGLAPGVAPSAAQEPAAPDQPAPQPAAPDTPPDKPVAADTPAAPDEAPAQPQAPEPSQAQPTPATPAPATPAKEAPADPEPMTPDPQETAPATPPAPAAPAPGEEPAVAPVAPALEPSTPSPEPPRPAEAVQPEEAAQSEEASQSEEAPQSEETPGSEDGPAPAANPEAAPALPAEAPQQPVPAAAAPSAPAAQGARAAQTGDAVDGDRTASVGLVQQDVATDRALYDDGVIRTPDTLRIDPIVCPFTGPGGIDYKPGEISCGLLEVPEYRERPNSRMIELHYVKIAARPADQHGDTDDVSEDRDDPIIYLTGGPGVKVENYVRRLKDHKVVDHRDLYILEQRGIGYSGDFCPFFVARNPGSTNAGTMEDVVEALVGQTADCFARADQAGVDLAGYSTIENARDVKALREALGFETWNLWGISYGSVLGQAYLRADPDGVRAAVIDAIVPLAQDETFFNTPQYFDRDLGLLADLCNEDEGCAANFPEIRAQVVGALASLEADPIVVEAVDTEAYPSGSFTVLPPLATNLPFGLLYEQSNYPYIPALIDAMARVIEARDTERFKAITAQAQFSEASSSGMSFAIYCRDGWTLDFTAAAERARREVPDLAAGFVTNYMTDDVVARLCGLPTLAPRPASDYTGPQIEVPTVIVEGRMDPITPPELAEKIFGDFATYSYVEFPYAGHGPTRSVDCAGAFLTDFFDNPDPQSVDRSCAEGMEKPTFSGPLFLTDAPARIATMAGADTASLVVPAVWGGLSAAILVLAALIYTVAPVARLINQPDLGREAVPTRMARPLAWLTAVAGAASAVGLAVMIGLTFDANEALLLFGILPLGEHFLWPGLAAGVLGFVLLIVTYFSRRRTALPIGTLLGLILTGLAAIALALFYVSLGLLPTELVGLPDRIMAMVQS